MSGIAGILRLDGRPVDPVEPDRMLDAIAHRGGDARSTWSDGPVGLGAVVRWSVPGAERESMPLVQGDLALVADARIDNRAELHDLLGVDPELPDGQLILAAFRRWGDQCAKQLVGDFAFAIWDGSNGSLFCARDHMGVRPFVYHRAARTFAFASEPRALLALPEVPRRPSELMVAYSLVDVLEDRTLTFFDGVDRLPPANAMTLGRKDRLPRPYWHPRRDVELRLSSDGEYEERFREAFREAVRCRLRSRGPVGSELSGGLDSSSVTCMAGDLLGDQTLTTVTAAFTGPRADESSYRRAVLDSGSFRPIQLDEYELAPSGAAARSVQLQGEPFGSIGVLMELALYQLAARSGVRVLLDGFDGDTVVSHGLGGLSELLRRGGIGMLNREVRAVSRRLGSTPWSVWRSQVLEPVAPEIVRRAYRRVRGGGGNDLEDSLVNRRLAADLGLEHQVRALADPNRRSPRDAREEHARDLESGLNAVALEIRDRAAAAAGLDLRHPFFDLRLVELCLSLPSDQKLRDGWARSILRRSMAGLLPENVRSRTDKAGVSPVFVRSLVASEEQALRELIRSGGGAAGRFLEPGALERASRSFGRVDTALGLWHALCIALWMGDEGVWSG